MGSVFGKIDVETPSYDVLASFEQEKIEVRKYGARYEAYVVSSEFPDAKTEKEFSSAAFWTLAKYIGVMSTPQNEGQASHEPEAVDMTAPVVMSKTTKPQSIDMTAPVVMGGKTDEEQTMAFILPHKFVTQQEKPPTPSDKRVHIRLVEGETVAVNTFAGISSPDRSAKRALRTANTLENDLEGNQFKVVKDEDGNPIWTFRGYNSPFVLPCYRTNEVAIRVEAQ
ncbi:Heme-binding-like protein At3g10130, chloroplastic [Hondaea fermentalgiana]|uniref:Heme-binding-like protein At3g10130, chloroplastic n=1 Tax=Hondaea fermentalgiana TaxID=2315210 RepID=A0A2R5GXR3_9STRA|nr:Heme-binding-like protein At3g10130, chloroplastic [Hondaea fermentalgiana]|eukprot:GBG33493.1 Heme-binding-like protein At3g10130, chloroplastic [Hondaea fermentalgiana]